MLGNACSREKRGNDWRQLPCLKGGILTRHPPLSLEQDWQEALLRTRSCVNSMQPNHLRLPQWRPWLPHRHHWLGDEDGNCILSVFTLSSQYPLVKEYGGTNPSHTMNDANLMHDAPAWVVFLFLACHVYYCSTSVAVMSVIMEFNLLPPDYSSTFWLVKGTFVHCGLWREYPTLNVHLCHDQQMMYILCRPNWFASPKP